MPGGCWVNMMCHPTLAFARPWDLASTRATHTGHYPPMHAEHEKIPTLVPFHAWRPFLHLWCTPSKKDISIGLFLCLVPFLHPWCMPSTNTHHISVFSCSVRLLHSLKHAEHENTLIFVFGAFSTCWEWFTLSIKSFQHDEGPAPSLNIYILLNTF